MLPRWKSLLIDIIAAVFILLFVYTATNKILTHRRFVATLNEAPLIGFWSPVVSWLIPAIELSVALLLFVPKLRVAGLTGALLLMAVFTLYISYMVSFTPHLPCSCGGIISQLSWHQHFWLNLVFTLIAGVGLWLNHDAKDFIRINRTSRKPV